MIQLEGEHFRSWLLLPNVGASKDSKHTKENRRKWRERRHILTFFSVVLLYDHFGSIDTVSDAAFDELKQANGEVRVFNKLHLAPFNSMRPFFRNHRKVLVTDSNCAFVGGMNMTEGK